MPICSSWARLLSRLWCKTKLSDSSGGNLSVALLVLSAISAVVAGLTSWRKDRLKDGHNPRVLTSIRISATASLLAVVLGFVNQYHARRQADELRTAQMHLSVLTSLSGYRVDMLDDYAWLLSHSATTKNYFSYEAARRSSVDAALAVPDWGARVAESDRLELSKSKSAFDHLQKIARDVLITAATYPNMVPEPLTDWATTTLAIKFSDLPQVVDAYHVTPESVRYAHLIGQAVGSITGGMTSSADVITR
jgi:hypothetical protein